MPNVKVDFTKNEVKILELLLQFSREDIMGEQTKLKEEGIKVDKVLDKLYYKVVGASSKANKKR